MSSWRILSGFEETGCRFIVVFGFGFRVFGFRFHLFFAICFLVLVNWLLVLLNITICVVFQVRGS